MAKVRINVYIDGFSPNDSVPSPAAHSYGCWLNLLELSKRLINPEAEEVLKVYCFSALIT
jgi:hypothetical protein